MPRQRPNSKQARRLSWQAWHDSWGSRTPIFLTQVILGCRPTPDFASIAACWLAQVFGMAILCNRLIGECCALGYRCWNSCGIDVSKKIAADQAVLDGEQQKARRDFEENMATAQRAASRPQEPIIVQVPQAAPEPAIPEAACHQTRLPAYLCFDFRPQGEGRQGAGDDARGRADL